MGCFASVDGTDVRVQEPSPFDPLMYSHKFRASGIRYEVGVCIATGQIVWLNGPYKCGAKADVTIFREGMKNRLAAGERVVADKGYGDQLCLTPRNVPEEYPCYTAKFELDMKL